MDAQYSKCGAIIALYTFILLSTVSLLLILAKKPIFFSYFSTDVFIMAFHFHHVRPLYCFTVHFYVHVKFVLFIFRYNNKLNSNKSVNNAKRDLIKLYDILAAIPGT